MDELTKLIDKMVHEKTFSMEGVEAVKALRDQAGQMETELVELRKIAKETEQKNDRLREERDKLRSEVADWKAREASLIKREDKATDLERARAVADAKAETYRECVGLVFRNTTLRREMYGQDPVQDNGITMTLPKNETVTETVE